MLAQNISVCGNLFTKNSRAFLLNDEEKFLSSSEIINATGVVQKSVASRTSSVACQVRRDIGPGCSARTLTGEWRLASGCCRTTHDLGPRRLRFDTGIPTP